MHMMSKSDLTGKKKETIRNSEESCTIVKANGTITTTEEATFYVKYLDMLITVQLLACSPAFLPQ